MGLLSRNKGKTFERAIATEMRKFWPDALIRRASQGERADNADVFIEFGPAFLKQLWLELQDAINPTPMVKLMQAERDVARVSAIAGAPIRYPIVVWHKIRARTIFVSMRSKTFDYLRGHSALAQDVMGDLMVTIELPDFLAILKHMTSLAS